MTSGIRRQPVLNRRTFLIASGAATLAVACSSDPESEPTTESADGYPVEITGQLGTTTLQAQPTRVVSVGQYRDTDAAVALGVVPLLSPDLSGFIEGGVSPWLTTALDGRTLELTDVSDLPLEKIAALDPELILATDRSSLEEEWDTLGAIAPTLSYENGYNKDTWQVTTRRIGKALGKEAEAEILVTDTENAIAAARSDNPELEGKTFTLGPVTADGTINTINSVDDASVRFLTQLGMRLSPSVESLPPGNFPGRSIVSPENLEALDADVMMITYNTESARTTMESQPIFTRVPAVARGSYVPIDLATAISVGFPSALSIQYALDNLVPKIKSAAVAS